MTLVSLDATNHAPVTVDFYRRLEGCRKTRAAHFVFEVLTKRLSSIEEGSYFFWDALAAAVAVDERFTTIEDASLRVLEEGPDQGRTERSGGEPGLTQTVARVRVCRGADLAAFEQRRAAQPTARTPTMRTAFGVHGRDGARKDRTAHLLKLRSYRVCRQSRQKHRFSDVP